MAEASMRRLTVGLALALVVAAGGAQADGKVTITQQVWNGFQQYQAWLTSTGSGYYAITKEGDGGGSAGCPSNNCSPGPSLASAAIAACQKANPGRECIVFAKNQDPVVDYQIAP